MKKNIFLLALCFCLTAAAQAQPSAAPSMITIGGENFYVYTIKQGDTFYSLGRQFSTDEAAIRASNPHVADGIKVGQVIKIPVVRPQAQPMTERRLSRTFDIHTVNQGETAYSILRRYGLSLQTLLEDNPGLDPEQLAIGQKINIRIKSQGRTEPEEIREEITTYAEALNKLDVDEGLFTRYAVKQGETLYSLGRLFQLPIDTLMKYNAEELREGLKMGSILRIPVAGASPAALAQASSAGASVATPTPSAQGAVQPSAPPQTYPTVDLPVVRPPDEQPFAGTRFRFREFNLTGPVRVVLLLPLRVGSSSNPQFLEFYQGFLLALGELKELGVSAQVDLFNTGRSLEEVRAVLRDPALEQADLIVGPVYDDCFAPAADFATERGIPIVSPLGSIDNIESPAVFQVFPDASSKSNKLREDLTADKNVIVISASNIDSELQAEVEPLLPASAHRVAQGSGMATQIENLLSSEKENVLVVLSGGEVATDEILARISSVQNNLQARSLKNPAIKVIGSSKWARYQNIDRNLYFKLNVRYVTSYHADRGNQWVWAFDNRYVAEFGSLPTQYAYRGYDVGKMFAGSIKLHGDRFATFLNDRDLPLLQVPYRFTQFRPNGKYVNDTWVKVCYGSNYTIEAW